MPRLTQDLGQRQGGYIENRSMHPVWSDRSRCSGKARLSRFSSLARGSSACPGMFAMADARLWDRPLSPHLQISRWTSTMAVSIMHRITGGAPYVGTILLAFWLLSMASGPAAFERAQWFFGSIIGRLILFADTLILVQHLVGGIRALIWDFGYGMEPGTLMAMARASPIAAAILTDLDRGAHRVLRENPRPLIPDLKKTLRKRPMADNKPDTRVPPLLP